MKTPKNTGRVQVESIRAEEYGPGQTRESHVFLAGHLHRPLDTPHFHEERIEWIVCRYAAGADGRPHWHALVTEYQMVTEGRMGCLEIASGETHWFGPGDLVRIPAGVCVQRLVPEAASSMVVKIPSLSEKTHCNACPRDCARRIEPCQLP